LYLLLRLSERSYAIEGFLVQFACIVQIIATGNQAIFGADEILAKDRVDFRFNVYSPPEAVQTFTVKEVPMRTVNGLHMLLLSAILCAAVQTAAGQSSKAEVLAALTERDKAFVAGDETKVAEFMSEDYFHTDVSGKIQDKQAWLNEYYRPLAPLLKSGKTQLATYDRSDVVVRDFGDRVVVTGKVTLKFVGVNPWNPNATYPPGPARTYRFTQVWIKRGGAWKLAEIHNAISAEQSGPSTPTDSQVKAGVQMLTATQGVDFNGYLLTVYLEVKKNWFATMPASVQLGDQGQNSVQFRILKDGTIPDDAVKLVLTSGKKPLDDASLRAIRKAGPFANLPEQYSGRFIELRFNFYYNSTPSNPQ
jgi:TonB family protein